MGYRDSDLMTVRARLDLPSVAIEVQHLDLPCAINSDLAAIDEYRIDLSLTPRTPAARLSFQNRWPAHRFEALGKVYLLPPGEAVRARSDAGTQDAVVCYLKPSTIEEWLDGSVPYNVDSLDVGLDIRSMTVARLMSRLAEEACDPGFARAAMCEALSMQIVVELGRYYLTCDRGISSALSNRQLALIDERLRGSREPPVLAELAILCGISTRHLTRAFRASRGCSIGAYIRGHQIEAAKTALAAGECVKAIAHSLGFSSRSSFAHAFQKVTGVAPHQFRKQRIGEGHRAVN